MSTRNCGKYRMGTNTCGCGTGCCAVDRDRRATAEAQAVDVGRIKTWLVRRAEGNSTEGAMLAEIAELRAALANEQEVSSRLVAALNEQNGPTHMGEPVIASRPVPQASEQPVELQGVAEQFSENSGFWRTCSGCHESEDGHDVGRYAYSDTLKCKLGKGCSECGGIGAVWDNIDYEAMHAEDEAEQPVTAGAARQGGEHKKEFIQFANSEDAAQAGASELSLDTIVELGDKYSWNDPESGNPQFDRLGFGQACYAIGRAAGEREMVVFGGKRMGRTYLAGLEQDAARYRHLRECNSGSLVIVQILGMGDDEQVVLTEADADDAIDKARAAIASQSTEQQPENKQ